MSHDVTLSLLDVFNSATTATEMTNMDIPFLADFLAEIGTTFLIPIFAFGATILLIFLCILCVFWAKLKYVNLGLLIVALGSFIYAGFSFLQLTSNISDILLDAIGFLGLFINLEEIFILQLSMGYWVTLMGLIASIIFSIVTLKSDETTDEYESSTAF